jgi:iron complex outermembrane receptor protein
MGGITRNAFMAGTAIICAMATPAQAQEKRFDVPAQAARSAIVTLARQADVQIIASRGDTRGKQANAVKGTMSVEQALARMLGGTGLVARRSSGQTFVVTRERAQPVPASAPATAPRAAPEPVSQVEPEATPAVESGEVIVTGSRIRRESFDTASPVTALGGEEISESGRTELSEVIAELPSVSSTLNDRRNSGDVQNDGLSSVQLRSLSDNRTLVLVDGRRTVSNSANANRVSLSTIPNGFVSRVDIITGGTSSVYGSDAVAGVVNIITESKKTGLRLGARTEFTDAGGGREHEFDASFGTKFADGRGYFLISGSYDRQDPIRANQRAFALTQWEYDWDPALGGINEYETLYTDATGIPTSGDRPIGTFPPNKPADLSSSIPGGVFYGSSSARDRFYRGGTLVPLGPDVQTGGVVNVGTSDAGNSGYFLPNRDGYSTRDVRWISGERERYLGAAKFDFEISDKTSIFAQVQYSKVKTLNFREPSAITADDTFPVIDRVTGVGSEVTLGRIPCQRATGTGSGPCNPFVPAEIRADVTTGSTNRGVYFTRRLIELGPQATYNDRETVRSWFGARGDAWGNWKWETSFAYGQFVQDQVRAGEINGLRLKQALDATTVNGQIVCRDTSNGCVPINLFGEGSITPEAAAFIKADLRQRATLKQHSFSGFLTGDLFDLPAGPVGAAFGIEYRKDSQKIEGDDYSRFGGTSGPPVPNFGGSISVFEGYAEVNAPLVKDKPGIELLSVDASARVGTYDIKNVGTVFSFRGGVQYAPVKDIRFRASFARAQRAPDLTELFSPPRGDFDDISDICDGVTPTTAGRIAANCRANPGIQALFASQAASGSPQVFDQSGTSVFSPNAGNLALKEETADTFTLGAVVTPSFLKRFTLSVDYYDIRIKDAITAYGNQAILTQCYDSDLPASANPFCGDITRNPNNGQLSGVTQREFNLAGFKTSGIDVAAEYRFDFDGIGIPGKWSVRYDATHLLKYETSFIGLTGLVTTDERGELVSGTFKYRARGSLSWRHEGLSLRWTAVYYGKIYDSLTRLNDYRTFKASNPNAEYPLFLNIPAVWQHNVYAGYSFKVRDAKLRLYGGVTNLFDKTSPLLPAGDVLSGSTNNYNPTYDVAGRRFYMGLSLDF